MIIIPSRQAKDLIKYIALLPQQTAKSKRKTEKKSQDPKVSQWKHKSSTHCD